MLPTQPAAENASASSADPADGVDAHIDYIADRVERGFAPLVDVAKENFERLLTLSGGALIASVTVVQFFAEKVKIVHHGWLLYTSWSLFLLTIVASLTGLNWLGSLRTYRLSLYLHKHAVASNLTDITTANAMAVQDAIIERADAELKRRMHGFDANRVVCNSAFILALAALALFTYLNSPF